MTDFGSQIVPYRGAVWNGMDRDAAGDRGEDSLLKIVGGYVRGREIRTWPGWRTAVDPVPDAADLFSGVFQDGYRQAVVDAKRPVALRTAPGDKFPLPIASTETMRVWADPVALHCFVQLRRRILMIGESRLRIEPVVAAPGSVTPAVVTKWTKDGSNRAVLFLSINALGTGGTPNCLQVGDAFYVEGLVDLNTTDAAVLNGKSHLVIAIAGAPSQVTVQTTVALASVSTTLTGICGRTRGNKTGLLGQGKTTHEALENERVDDPDALTAWWIDNDIDLDADVVTQANAAYVANRQRDFGDDTSATAPIGGTGVKSALVEGHVPQAFGPLVPIPNWGITRRPTLSLPFRVVPALGGDRLVLAARGYGCMFQVPCQVPVAQVLAVDPFDGATEPHNSLYDRPRCLGVPKGMLMFDSARADINATNFTVRADTLGWGQFNVPQVFSFRVAYRDDATGEVGLPSEPWTFTLGGSAVSPPAGNSYDVTLQIHHPGYVLAECLAMSVLIYATKANEFAYQHVATIQLEDLKNLAAPAAGQSQSSVYGLVPRSSIIPADVAAAVTASVSMVYAYKIPLDLAPGTANSARNYDSDFTPPDGRQMPRGAKFASITRGSMISGGAIGTHGRDDELMPGSFSHVYDDTPTAGFTMDTKEVYIRRVDKQNLPVADVKWPSGNGTLPSAYEGSPFFTEVLFPHPVTKAILNLQINSQAAFPTTFGAADDLAASKWAHHWQLLERPLRFFGDRTYQLGKAVWLQQFRGQVQPSELGQYGVTSAAFNIVVDAKKDDDVEAGSEFRGVLVLCTRRQTFTLTWSVAPGGTTPYTASNEHGCLSPNSMIEGDSMLAWIAERGPVAYTSYGTIEHIGKRLQRYFHGEGARFLRDSNGMMLHAFGAHDEERGLLLFGVFENRNRGVTGEVTVFWQGQTLNWDNAPDEAKSRFPCDTILAYSEADNAWSEWRPPNGLEALWMGPVTCKDGRTRLGWMAADKRLYVFDDDFGEFVKEPLIVTATLASTGTAITTGTSMGSDRANRNGLGSYVRPNCEAIVYGTDNAIKARITIASVAGAVITASAPVTIEVGDRILIAPRTLQIETTFLNRKGPGPTRLSSVTLRGQLRSRVLSGKSGGVPQPLWMKCSVQRMDRADSTAPVKTHTLHRDAPGDFFGVSDTLAQNRALHMNKGAVEGHEQKIVIEAFGGAQLCLQDLIPEIA
jgi:hypothetical protein